MSRASIRRSARARAAALVSIWLVACGPATPVAPASHEAPARVESPVPEGQLATVRLSPEAAARLHLATSTVEPTTVPATRLVGAEVIVPPGLSVVVAAPIAGVVSTPAGARLPVPGALVRAGQPLALLAPITVLDRDARARADREVAVARAALTPAQARLARLEALSADQATSARLVEEAAATRDVAQAELAAAEARARATRSRPLVADVAITVRAPFDGVVRARAVVEGQAVAPGATLLELVPAGSAQVRVPVYAGDLARLDPSRPAIVRPLGDDRGGLALSASPLDGPPTADALAATVDRFYDLPRDARLAVGERVLVELPLTLEQGARRVPASAVVLDASGASWVYVCGATERAYVRTRIDPLRTVGEHVVFTRGPAEGACVVSEGATEVFGSEFPPGH